MMKLNLLVNGREMTFSEEKLTAILEEYFECNKADVVEERSIAATPTIGKWFKVNPLTIDQNLFVMGRENREQEAACKLIREAFEEVKNNAKYAKPFKTYIPEKNWSGKKVKHLEKLAKNFGGHVTDWVEKALEWAQRIQNGESWETLCNNRDTMYFYRLVIWKDGNVHIIGSSAKSMYPSSPTSVSARFYEPEEIVDFAVPSVTRYD